MDDKNKKSALPDISEITSMAGKLFKDVKQSVTEICSTYQKNRASDQPSAAPSQDQTQQAKPAEPVVPKTEEKPSQAAAPAEPSAGSQKDENKDG